MQLSCVDWCLCVEWWWCVLISVCCLAHSALCLLCRVLDTQMFGARRLACVDLLVLTCVRRLAYAALCVN